MLDSQALMVAVVVTATIWIGGVNHTEEKLHTEKSSEKKLQ